MEFLGDHDDYRRGLTPRAKLRRVYKEREEIEREMRQKKHRTMDLVLEKEDKRLLQDDGMSFTFPPSPAPSSAPTPAKISSLDDGRVPDDSTGGDGGGGGGGGGTNYAAAAAIPVVLVAVLAVACLLMRRVRTGRDRAAENQAAEFSNSGVPHEPQVSVEMGDTKDIALD